MHEISPDDAKLEKENAYKLRADLIPRATTYPCRVHRLVLWVPLAGLPAQDRSGSSSTCGRNPRNKCQIQLEFANKE